MGRKAKIKSNEENDMASPAVTRFDTLLIDSDKIIRKNAKSHKHIAYGFFSSKGTLSYEQSDKQISSVSDRPGSFLLSAF
jgi:hypothetical protein